MRDRRHRDRSPLYSRCRYADQCSVCVGTVRVASSGNIIDVQGGSLLARCPSSVEITRHGQVATSESLDMVGLLNLSIEKEQFSIICRSFLYVICVKHLLQPCAL